MSELLPVIAPTHGRATPQSAETVAPPDWDPSNITFGDVLSALNPLQYLPVVGTIYREITGDTVHPALRIAVGAAASVFLGPLGLATTMIGAAISEVRDAERAAPGAYWAQASAAYQRAGRAA